MSDTENTPSVDEIKAKLESEISAKYKAQFEEEKNKIISNRDQILEEKKGLEDKYKSFSERFKDIGEDDINEVREFKKQKEENEITRLLAEGKTDLVVDKLTRAQREEWNKELSTYDERLKAVQGEKENLSTELESLREKNTRMQKNQYLKDVVSQDDSFKKEFLSDFLELYGRKAEIDQETGKVYALGDDGKKLVDPHTGDLVPFDQYYAKQKVNHGLFWSGGGGTGHKGSGTGGDAAKKFKDLTWQERNQLRKEIGDSKYEQFVRDQLKK